MSLFARLFGRAPSPESTVADVLAAAADLNWRSARGLPSPTKPGRFPEAAVARAVTPLRSIADVIARCGGVKAVARALDTGESAVDGWKDRGRVPAWRVVPLARLAGITAEELLALNPAPKARRPYQPRRPRPMLPVAEGTVRALVWQAGGPKAVARALDVTDITIHNWMQRGVPEPRVEAFAAAASATVEAVRTARAGDAS